MEVSKGLVWCTGNNRLRILCMLESTWSMGHLFRDVQYNIMHVAVPSLYTGFYAISAPANYYGDGYCQLIIIKALTSISACLRLRFGSLSYAVYSICQRAPTYR